MSTPSLSAASTSTPSTGPVSGVTTTAEEAGPSFALRAVTWLIAAYLRFCWATIRWRWINKGPALALWRARSPVIFALWHNRVPLGPSGWDFKSGAQPIRVMISKSKDGELIAHIMRRMNVGAVRGSSAKAGKQKGATAALREMLRLLKEGEAVAITPDGPRGPRMRAQMGVIQVARMSGAPILPFAWSCRPGKAFNSWDRILMPYPFARGAGVYGDLIAVPRQASDEDMEHWRQKLEDELNRISAEADRLVGRPYLAPADPAPPVEEPEPAETKA